MASQGLDRSLGSYIQGGAQISLELLQSLANFVPFPYVTAVVGVASQLIRITQTIQDNVAGVDILIERVKAIILVILTSLKGKTTQDVPKDLAQVIGRLSKDLLAIGKDIHRVKKRTDTSSLPSLVKATLGYGDNAGLIVKCTSRLEWAMRHFEVDSRIQDSIRIVRMANEVHEVHEYVQDVRRGVDTILENLDLGFKHSAPSSAIPPKPELFYGREIEMGYITHRIISTLPSRFGITGPGGIGKTSLASAVLEHPAIVQHFDSSIHWSRCDDATSPPLLVEVIARSFHLEQPSKDRLQDIKSFLLSHTKPRLLVLDNFETPWDVEGRQSEVTDILCALAAFPHLAILVTMRGTLPGVGRVRWSRPELPPLTVLPLKAAHDLYVEIDPNADNDIALEALLSELDHMPLAVTLMAKVGREGGETPTQLLNRWRLCGTEVIHEEGGDRLTSVNLSIQLSMRSNLMKKNPDALRVLSTLAMLPGGIRNNIIQELVPDVLDPAKARSVLLRTSLVYTRTETNSLDVLSPIRSYLAHYHPLTPQLWQGLHNFCFDYVERHFSDPWDNDTFIKALAIEEVNLETILSHALVYSPSNVAITTACVFTRYQCLTYALSGPHLAILMVATAKRVATEDVVAECLQWLGSIHRVRQQYKDAVRPFEEARGIFLRLGNANSAAHCLLSLGSIARVQCRFDDARAVLELSRDEYLRLGDIGGSIQCIQILALVAYYQGRYKDAQNAYEEVRGQIGVDDPYALQGLGDVACMEGRYEDARQAYKQSRAEVMQLGDLGDNMYGLLWLGVVDFMQERYGSARAAFLEAQEGFCRIQDDNGDAECLKWLGNVDWREGRIDEGRHKLERARRKFSHLGQDDDAAECTQFLGDADAADGRYEEGRSQVQDALETFRRLGVSKGVADCLTVLGEISVKQGDHKEARSRLEAACASYKEMGVGDWWQARCLKNLASALD